MSSLSPAQYDEIKEIWLGSMRRKITEYLLLDLDNETWICSKCDRVIGPARKSYKEGCLVYDRDPREVFNPLIEGTYTFSPDPTWCRILEFYCPGCGTLLETEPLPPGHPISHDIELDVDKMKSSPT
jgi:acetone carboxylase, gamma subunit